jgi:hypothetical protein
MPWSRCWSAKRKRQGNSRSFTCTSGIATTYAGVLPGGSAHEGSSEVVAAAASVAMVGGLLAWAAAPTAAATGSILVFGDDRLSVDGPSAQLEEEEFLQILQGDQPNTYIVRIWDESAGTDGGPGRPLLTGEGGCAPTGQPTAQVECTFDSEPSESVVDFSRSLGPVNVAVMDNAPIALDFRGSDGPDYVQGGAGDDIMRGFGGDDLLFGGPGDDSLDGGADDDYIEGERGRDDMRGGSGTNSLDAADNTADVIVDCGGPPALLDFDEGKDNPTNCGDDPTPLPPEPIEPVDPPAPGEGSGTVDGVPTTVEVIRSTEDDNVVVTTTTPGGPVLNTGLLWLGPTAPLPTFPLNSLLFPVAFTPLLPNSLVNLSIWNLPTPPGTIPLSRADRSGPVVNVELSVDSQGVARGTVPVPQDQEPGTFTMQVNGITASGGQLSLNVGVVLAEEPPGPEPVEAITGTAKRGKGKKANVITVRGSVEGLSVDEVTPRFRVKGAKKWTTAKPVAVADDGTFRWRLKTKKKVSIIVASGTVRSDRLNVPQVKKR